MRNKWIPALILVITLLISAVATGCAGSSGTSADISEEETMTVTYIDVGKGDCILIEKGSSVILIDTGYEETAEMVISFLQKKGVETIDALIITHYDKDHVGGAAAIAETFSISQIYLPDYEGSSSYYQAFMEAIEAKNLQAENVAEDITFSLEGVTYTVFASDVEYDAADGSEGNDNDVSLVIEAEYGEDSYLFAGDLEKEGIKAYLAQAHDEIDVLKVPHHGSSSGKLDDFIASVNSKIAVITDSEEEPAEDKVLEMLSGTDVYRSSVNGTIIITGNGTGEYSISTDK